MSTMILEVYDALKAAGAPEDKAQAAATVLANADNRFDRIDSELARLEAKVGIETARLEAKVADVRNDIDKLKLSSKADLSETKADILKWVIGAIGFQSLAIMGAVFVIVKFVK